MTKHPARYTDAFLPIFTEWVGHLPRVLDPMGGTGKLKQAIPHAVCMDLEMEWARMAGLRANAIRLPFADGTFDAIVVSPTYGNRMADKLDGRVNYTAYKGAPLHINNGGHMQWGEQYQVLHINAWKEATRVLKWDGIFILNIKDHIRNKKRIHVTDFHKDTLIQLGMKMVEQRDIPVKGAATHLSNGDARVPYESVIKFAY